jgi:hypothetical protein
MRPAGTATTVPSSFRDPDGFLFERDGALYRQVNTRSREAYDLFMASGLYDELVASKLLIPHAEMGPENAATAGAYKVLKPERIGFISYPYEWSFSQLQQAALSTLAVQKAALARGMSLKDASAYNIQFRDGRPVLIDTLSFERCREGRPWPAYGQFCRHFLAPLALMSFRDLRLGQLLRVHLDGVPLDLASSLLPWSTRLHFPLLCHLHLHAQSQKRFAGGAELSKGRAMSRFALLALVDSLESGVRRLRVRAPKSFWASYYDETNYSDRSFKAKKEILSSFLDRIRPKTVWDLGANTGLFSRIASEKGAFVVSFDMDPMAVEIHYRQCAKDLEARVLPLVLDLTNPSPSIGWENAERLSIGQRAGADCALALALVHHLAISNNLPLDRIAAFFAKLSEWLVIEFVPKSDSQVRRMLSLREDIFPDYRQEIFEERFGAYFAIENAVRLGDSERTLYLMRRR